MIEDAGRRSRSIEKKLKDVQELPDSNTLNIDEDRNLLQINS